MRTHTSMSDYQLGALYMTLDRDTREYLDSVIRYGNNKISTIRFLMAKLQLNIPLARHLFESRKTFLESKDNPFRW